MAVEKKGFKIKANGFLFSFTHDEVAHADLVKISPASYSLVRDHESIVANITSADPSGKKQEIEINGEVFSIEISDAIDQVLERMGFGAGINKQPKEIKAPMPGLVIEIAVSNGQEVNEGDKILILEAMKMENNIMIPGAARIKNIVVKKGQAVEKGQVLVELE